MSSSTGHSSTRRDIERLFGVGKVRAAALMKTFGAKLVGNQRTLPRTRLLQQLKKHRGRAAFRVEEERRARLVAEFQQARLTGVRFKVPAETMSAKLANLPDGVSVERGRIEVRFDGAEDALARLYTLAQALAAASAIATGGAGEVVLPQVIVDAGPQTTARFLEFFTGRLRRDRSRCRC